MQFFVRDLRFTSKILQSLELKWQSVHFAATRVKSLREAAMERYSPPHEDVVDQVTFLSRPLEPWRSQLASWMEHVCRYRDHFVRVALVFDAGDRGATYWLFDFAKQQPRGLALTQLVPLLSEPGDRAMNDRTPSGRRQFDFDTHEHTFSYDFNGHRQEWMGAWEPGASVCVLQGIWWGSEDTLYSDFDIVTLDDYISTLPESTVTHRRAPADRADARQPRIPLELYRGAPWLVPRQLVAPVAGGHGGHGGGAPVLDAPAAPILPPIEPGIVDEAYDAVSHIRDMLVEMEEGLIPGPEYFRIDPRGDPDTLRRHGVPVKYIRASARSERAVFFCNTYSMQKSFDMMYEWGLPLCHRILKEWCLRMDFLFERWRVLGGEDPKFRFAADAFVGYEPQATYREAIGALPAGHPAQRRVLRLEALEPSRPR